jgi:hypothetical protein
MPCVGFESTIRASERVKTVHVLDLADTVTGITSITAVLIQFMTYLLTPPCRLY